MRLPVRKYRVKESEKVENLSAKAIIGGIRNHFLKRSPLQRSCLAVENESLYAFQITLRVGCCKSNRLNQAYTRGCLSKESSDQRKLRRCLVRDSLNSGSDEQRQHSFHLIHRRMDDVIPHERNVRLTAAQERTHKARQNKREQRRAQCLERM